MASPSRRCLASRSSAPRRLRQSHRFRRGAQDAVAWFERKPHPGLYFPRLVEHMPDMANGLDRELYEARLSGPPLELADSPAFHHDPGGRLSFDQERRGAELPVQLHPDDLESARGLGARIGPAGRHVSRCNGNSPADRRYSEEKCCPSPSHRRFNRLVRPFKNINAISAFLHPQNWVKQRGATPWLSPRPGPARAARGRPAASRPIPRASRSRCRRPRPGSREFHRGPRRR